MTRLEQSNMKAVFPVSMVRGGIVVSPLDFPTHELTIAANDLSARLRFQVQTELKQKEFKCFRRDPKTISDAMHLGQITWVRANRAFAQFPERGQLFPDTLTCDLDNPVVKYQGCMTMNFHR